MNHRFRNIIYICDLSFVIFACFEKQGSENLRFRNLHENHFHGDYIFFLFSCFYDFFSHSFLLLSSLLHSRFYLPFFLIFFSFIFALSNFLFFPICFSFFFFGLLSHSFVILENLVEIRCETVLISSHEDGKFITIANFQNVESIPKNVLNFEVCIC